VASPTGIVISFGLDSTNSGRIRLFQTPTNVTIDIAPMTGLDSGMMIER